jgi:hypothetical protein
MQEMPAVYIAHLHEVRRSRSGSRASDGGQKNLMVYEDWPGVVNIAGLGVSKEFGIQDPID